MHEPQTILESLRDYWGLFTSIILFGLGVVWWFIRRMILKLDATQEDHRATTDKRLSGLDARTTILERDSVKRPEHAQDMAQVRSEIRDGFKAITDRMDRFLDSNRKS